jgi:hypothetical protein
MNFAYLDTLMRPLPEPVIAIPCELAEHWKSFENELGEFKSEFTKTQIELVQNLSKLHDRQEESGVIRMMIDTINSQDLKEKLQYIIDEYESEEGINALTLQCGEGKGRLEAMSKILKDTHAERYARFTCFVCMDKLVDLFIDPCGHVICDSCWIKTKNRENCPGCRGRIHGVKKIYTLN